MAPDAGKALRAAQEQVETKLARSAEIFKRGARFLPGGVTSNARFTDPFPLVVKNAKGARLWDVDGNEYIDCRLALGPVMLGHAAPEITRAVEQAARGGTVYGLSHEAEVNLAEKIAAAVPGAEMATFCSSGSEATLNALRLARAYTGRPKIAKFEGGYHGGHDAVLVSLASHRDDVPGRGRPASPGIPEAAWADTAVLPFNDPLALELIGSMASELAAVIVEPVQGVIGGIPARPEFLKELRQLTARHGVLLIFDEVITGFRLALGGAQEYFGVRADLMTFGKVLGGGLPFGCLAGRRDVLQYLAVDEARRAARTPTFHGGTFNGNPVSVAAANAAIDFLMAHRGLYAELNARGDRIRREVSTLASARGIVVAAMGAGSLFSFRFVAGDVHSVRDLAGEDPALLDALFLFLILGNILTHPKHSFLCVAHTDDDITAIVGAYRTAFDAILAA